MFGYPLVVNGWSAADFVIKEKSKIILVDGVLGEVSGRFIDFQHPLKAVLNST
jgi:hypothetical protein